MVYTNKFQRFNTGQGIRELMQHNEHGHGATAWSSTRFSNT